MYRLLACTRLVASVGWIRVRVADQRKWGLGKVGGRVDGSGWMDGKGDWLDWKG